MTFKKFKNTDIFHNTLEMNPSYDFVVYDGNVYLNNSSASIDLYGGAASGNIGSYPYIPKSSDKLSFKSMSSSSFALIADGTKLTSSYPQTASIVREYITSSAATITGTANHLNSLQNTLNHYRTVSEYYNFGYYTGSAAVNLISIPSIVFGRAIKKGTVEMNFYVSGALYPKVVSAQIQFTVLHDTPLGWEMEGDVAKLRGNPEHGGPGSRFPYGGDNAPFDPATGKRVAPYVEQADWQSWLDLEKDLILRRIDVRANKLLQPSRDVKQFFGG